MNFVSRFRISLISVRLKLVLSQRTYRSQSRAKKALSSWIQKQQPLKGYRWPSILIPTPLPLFSPPPLPGLRFRWKPQSHSHSNKPLHFPKPLLTLRPFVTPQPLHPPQTTITVYLPSPAHPLLSRSIQNCPSPLLLHWLLSGKIPEQGLLPLGIQTDR